MSVGGGCDEPLAGAGCVPEVPAGVEMLPGADVVGAGEVGLVVMPLEPDIPGAVPIADP